MLNRVSIIFFLFISLNQVFGQILVNNNYPYDSPTWLVDNILLGGGIVASNHTFAGDSVQIGWFNATNTSLGIDSGIIIATGEIDLLDPASIPTFPILPNVATDLDLLAVANSVPPLLPAPYTSSFSVSSINDVAKLEFDFIPTSDTVTFNYVFGSQEYFGFENSQYNDVFGFFLSGPGIIGPYSSPAIHPNGSINLAVVPNSSPPLPITISSVNSITPINQQYFVDNQNGLDTIGDADGYTTVLTATALVQCGEVYHIRLAIADGSDQGLSSYVWLEAGSFSSPTLEVVDNLGIDSTFMQIPCNSTVTLTADGGPGASYLWSNGSSDSIIVVGSGQYWVSATSLGCSVLSDTITIISDLPPVFDLGPDYTIACNTSTIIDPIVSGGLGVYSYSWSNGSTDSVLVAEAGTYILTIDDGTGCIAVDTINITEDLPAVATVSGGGEICADASPLEVVFEFNGVLPWDLTYFNGEENIDILGIPDYEYIIFSSLNSTFSILSAVDINGCEADISGIVNVSVNPLPTPEITPNDATIYIGETIELSVGQYDYYEWYNHEDSLLTDSEVLVVSDSGQYYVWVEDQNGCSATSLYSNINLIPKTQIFIPNTFTPNADRHNELLVVIGKNVLSYNLEIYTRWGEQVFSSSSIYKFWDGTHKGSVVPEGTYFYNMNVIGIDGNFYSRNGLINVIY